jgi:hypothetical protein
VNAPDDAIARAMNRVLEAERAAHAAVEECERACAEILERARHQRRSILDRAQVRASIRPDDGT